VAVGSDLQANAAHAVAVGTRVQANAMHALAMGSNETWALGGSSIAMGDAVKARSQGSVAIGQSAAVAMQADHALALGAQARVESRAAGGIALGYGAVADRGSALSVGGGSIGTRQIIQVAPGTEPTDAVNVAQLREAVAAMMAELQQLRSQLGARQAGT
jgi:autotransporter adhesin